MEHVRQLIELFRTCWVWLGHSDNRGRVVAIAAVAGVFATVAGVIATLSVRTDSNEPVESNGAVRLSVMGKVDIQDPSIDESEVSIGLLWGVEDDRHHYWTDGVLSNTGFSVKIKAAEPPEDALMFMSPVESTTPGREELLKLGVAFLIAYRDENESRVFDRGDELLGGCRTHVVTFRDGPKPSSISWNLSEGFSVAEAISPEEHGLDENFDILRSVQPSTRLLIVVPRTRDEIRFPNWT